MKLITPELEKRFAEVGYQEDAKDPLVIAKFFFPISKATWWAIAYYPDENICFGYVTGMFEDEYGYFSIQELEEIKLTVLGIRIERDIHFTECRMSEVKSGKVS